LLHTQLRIGDKLKGSITESMNNSSEKGELKRSKGEEETEKDGKTRTEEPAIV